VTEPRVLPLCGADDLQTGPPVGRYLPEPAKLLKLYICAEYSLADQEIPSNCDWYGASGLARIEVQAALTEAVLLGLVLLGLWARRLRRSAFASGSLLVALAGLVVGVFGSAYEWTALAPIGLALFGLGTIGLGWTLRTRWRPAFAWLTVALGAVGVLGALDRGITMIPYLPVPPSFLRLLLELVWVPWAVVVLLRRRRATAAAPAAEAVAPSPERAVPAQA
jgi:hypothetical protein